MPTSEELEKRRQVVAAYDAAEGDKEARSEILKRAGLEPGKKGMDMVAYWRNYKPKPPGSRRAKRNSSPRATAEELQRRAGAVKEYDAATSSEARHEVLKRFGFSPDKTGTDGITGWRKQVRKWGAAGKRPPVQLELARGKRELAEQFPPEKRREIVAEYMTAPLGGKNAVLLRHGIPTTKPGHNRVRMWRKIIDREEGAKQETKEVRRFARSIALTKPATYGNAHTGPDPHKLEMIQRYKSAAPNERPSLLREWGIPHNRLNQWAFTYRKAGYIDKAGRPIGQAAVGVVQPFVSTNGHNPEPAQPRRAKRKMDPETAKLKELFFRALMKTDAAKDVIAQMFDEED